MIANDRAGDRQHLRSSTSHEHLYGRVDRTPGLPNQQAIGPLYSEEEARRSKRKGLVRKGRRRVTARVASPIPKGLQIRPSSAPGEGCIASAGGGGIRTLRPYRNLQAPSRWTRTAPARSPREMGQTCHHGDRRRRHHLDGESPPAAPSGGPYRRLGRTASPRVHGPKVEDAIEFVTDRGRGDGPWPTWRGSREEAGRSVDASVGRELRIKRRPHSASGNRIPFSVPP